MSTSPKQLVASLRKSFGEDAAMLMGDEGTGVRSVCPTGIRVLDHHIIGVGGLPYGRIVEMYGNESSGKTTMMNKMLAGCQADGGIAVLVETEHSYDPAWARLHGVNTDDLVLLQPDYLDGDDGVLAVIEKVIERVSDRPVLVALDSVASTPTKAEVTDGVTGDLKIGEPARAWSKAMRILVGKLKGKDACLLLVNQTRTKIGVLYGNPETTPGGNAIKFYASVRLSVLHGSKIDSGGGREMTVMSTKNKVAPPYRKAKLRLDFDKGFNDKWATLNLAKDLKLIENKSQDEAAAIKALGWEQ